MNKKSDGVDKTPRLNNEIGELLAGSGKGRGNIVQIYKSIQDEQFKFFRNEFSLKFSVMPEGVNIAINITPAFLDGLKSVNEYIENFYLA